MLLILGVMLVATPLAAQNSQNPPPPVTPETEIIPPPGESPEAERGARPNAQGPPQRGSEPEVASPKTAEERDKLLAELYTRLENARSPEDAAPIAMAIENLWLISGSPTVSVLLDRVSKAIESRNFDLAEKLLDATVALAPDFTEAWVRRAFYHYAKGNLQAALGDLRRVLAFDARNFRALAALGQILRERDDKKGALRVFQELRKVHPQWPNIKQIVDELDREVEGQGI